MLKNLPEALQQDLLVPVGAGNHADGIAFAPDTFDVVQDAFAPEFPFARSARLNFDLRQQEGYFLAFFLQTLHRTGMHGAQPHHRQYEISGRLKRNESYQYER